MSLRARITLGYTLLVISSFSLIIYLILKDVRPRYLEAVEESTVDTAELLAAILSEQSENESVKLHSIERAMKILEERSFSARIYGIEKQNVKLYVYVTDKYGKLLYDSTGEYKAGSDFSKWNDIHLTLQGKYGARSTKTTPGDATTSTIFVAAPIKYSGEIVGVVSVGKPKNSVSIFVEIARKKILLSFILIGLTAVGLAIVLSYWLTTPVRKLTEYVNSIELGQNYRMPDLGTSEIQSLGTALKNMKTKLEGKNHIEDYIRTLTHEMKSPLTAIRGASEILREDLCSDTEVKFLNNIETEAIRLQNLVERMLELSKLENMRSITKESLQLSPVIEEVVKAHQPQFTKKHIELKLTMPQDLEISGDRFLIRQAIENLILNSLDFSSPDSKIEISGHKGAKEVFLTIRDFGTGIPDYAMPKVFDKFYSLKRPNSDKKSTGLGLAFVKEVMTLHDGKIQLTNTHPGLMAELVFSVH